MHAIERSDQLLPRSMEGPGPAHKCVFHRWPRSAHCRDGGARRKRMAMGRRHPTVVVVGRRGGWLVSAVTRPVGAFDDPQAGTPAMPVVCFRPAHSDDMAHAPRRRCVVHHHDAPRRRLLDGLHHNVQDS
jgi:hypothetical protein